MSSQSKAESSRVNLVGVWAPQHLLGLAEARLSGRLTGVVHLALMTTRTDFRRKSWEQTSRTTSLLEGAIGASSVMRIRVLPFVGRSWVARWAARSSQIDLDSEITVVGAYPGTEFWPPPHLIDARRFWLDDGTESMYAGATSYRPDYLDHVQAHASEIEERNSAHSNDFFTVFPVRQPLLTPPPTNLVKHRFEYLGFLERRGDGFGVVKGRILVDTHLGLLGERLHWDYVCRVVEAFGIDKYVPHRRTSRNFISRIVKELSVSVLDLDVPMELAANRVLHESCEVYLAPSSLWITYPMFASTQQSVVFLESRRWLRNSLGRRIPARSEGLREHLSQQWEILERIVSEQDRDNMYEVA